jgi:hypothetical protein
MRMRDRDGADTAARVELGSGLAVEKRDAIPEQISSVRLQEQSALAYRKFRFGADPQKAWRFFFEPVVIISGQPFERRPFSASEQLPFILASAVGWMIKSNETVTIFSCHFAGESRNDLTAFVAISKRQEAKH